MTPEEALRIVQTLTSNVREDSPPKAMWLTIKSVQEVVRKNVVASATIPEDGFGPRLGPRQADNVVPFGPR